MARPNVYQRPNALNKISFVSDQNGNPTVSQNQGTTFEIYDYIKVVAAATKQTLEFFKNVNSKTFPFTNIQENKLQVGEAFAIKQMFVAGILVSDVTGEIISVGAASSFIPGINVSQFSLLQENNRLMKPQSLMRANSLFNPFASTSTNNVFYPETDLTLQTLLQFIGQLDIPPFTYAAPTEQSLYLGMHWTGPGAILNLKNNS